MLLYVQHILIVLKELYYVFGRYQIFIYTFIKLSRSHRVPGAMEEQLERFDEINIQQSITEPLRPHCMKEWLGDDGDDDGFSSPKNWNDNVLNCERIVSLQRFQQIESIGLKICCFLWPNHTIFISDGYEKMCTREENKWEFS